MIRPVLLLGVLSAAPLLLGQAAAPSAPAQRPGVPESIGAQECRSCHATAHGTWAGARHARMLQAASAKSVIPEFSGTTRLRGRTYALGKDEAGYFILENYLQAQTVKRRIDYTLGSRRVQHYLTTLDDGRIVVLPPSYDVEKKEWFHNLDIVDLEESSATRVQVWNTNCFGCHVSGQSKNFDPGTKTFKTTWSDFGTSCERCHGPGGPHAAKYREKTETAADTRIVHPGRLDAETSTAICAQCHSLRDVTRPGFTGGSNYYDYFTPLLEYAQKKNQDPAYWPDGRPRRFSNEAVAFWMSQCFFKGGATCLSCHQDVHEPDIEKNAPLAQKRDALCTGCHGSLAADPRSHSRHAPSPEAGGVSCVDCHMPRTSVSLRHRMPDHTISIPAPRNTSRHGIPNACNECHRTQTPAWAEGRIAAWFPSNRRLRSEEDADAFAAAGRRDPGAAGALIAIAEDTNRPPLFRANAVGHLRGFRTPQGLAALLRLVKDPSAPVRTAAMLSLTDASSDAAVRAAMERGLTDPRRTVRMAAGLGLLNSGARPAVSADLAPALAAAIDDHAARARFLNDDPASQLDLGKMYFVAGDWRRAESSIRDALTLDPKIGGGSYFLGLSILGQGRVQEGVALLRRVDRSDAHRKDADVVLAKLAAN